MSIIGRRHELDCADVVEAVYLYLDGELAGRGRSTTSGSISTSAHRVCASTAIEQEVKTLHRAQLLRDGPGAAAGVRVAGSGSQVRTEPQMTITELSAPTDTASTGAQHERSSGGGAVAVVRALLLAVATLAGALAHR